MADQWGLGPAFVALKQENGWTYGSLLNHVRDFDAASERYDVNATFLQPFVSIHDAGRVDLLSEYGATCDGNAEQCIVPVNLGFSELTHFGDQPVSFQAGYHHDFDTPSGGRDLGLRFTVTFLFPK